ncbi:MAG: hypothetical protein QM674_20390 [Burkholderiaceae bacterium]
MMQLLSLDDAAPAHGRRLQYEYDALRQLTRVHGQDGAGELDLAYEHLGRGRLRRQGESGWLMGYDDPLHPGRLMRPRSAASSHPTRCTRCNPRRAKATRRRCTCTRTPHATP